MLPETGTTIHPKLQEALIGVKFSFVDPTTREWLKEAISAGAHLKEPNGLNISTWIRDRNILGVALLSHANNIQIGDIYGIGRDRVRRIINETSFTIWQNCSEGIREKFPYGEIPFDRSYGNQNPENMLLQDNLGSRIVGFLENGLTALGVRSELSDVSPQRLYKNLRSLRKLGFEVPGLDMTKAENLSISVGLQDTNLSDEQIQSLLDSVKLRFYQAMIKSKEIIVPVRDLLKQAGFYYRTDWDADLFYQAIKKAGIPFGSVKNTIHKGPQARIRFYHFIASLHLRRAIDSLASNPDLKRFLENHIKHCAGPEVPLPTTTKLQNPKEFGRCGRVFQECGISHQHYSKMNIDEFFQGCPVPVFRYDGSQQATYFYPISQKKALIGFITASPKPRTFSPGMKEK